MKTQWRGRGFFGAVIACVLIAATLSAASQASAQVERCFGRAVTITAMPNQITRGTPGADVIMGTNGNDDIRSLGGADRVCTKSGNDKVKGGSGKDRINLGSGNDTANGGKGDDTIKGGKGDDTIKGKNGDDTLNGGSGEDTIEGGKGDDRILGKGGADDLEGNGGADDLLGGGGNDMCDGGKGKDNLSSCNEASPIAPGMHRVGTGVQPGRYKADAAAFCTWTRLSGTTSPDASNFDRDEAIGSITHVAAGPAIVDISASDRSFHSSTECGTFRPYRAPSSPASSMGPGAYVVGSDIRPGTYRAQVAANCYWERLTGFGGNGIEQVIVNDFLSSAGPVNVTIASGDEGFRATDTCGTWTRQ